MKLLWLVLAVWLGGHSVALSQAAFEPESSLSQVTPVTQLTDIRPDHWAFSALQSLNARYGCLVGFGNGRFEGDRVITRAEAAVMLNACIESILKSAPDQALTPGDQTLIQQLQGELAPELATLRTQLTSLEARTHQLSETQFSPTTRLVGQTILGLQDSNSIQVDFFPRDGVPERLGETSLTFGYQTTLAFATFFTGQDLLLTGIQTGNVGSNAPFLFTNMGRLAYESNANNALVLSDLSYRFPLNENFGVIVGAAGVNPTTTFRGINPLEGAGQGALSLLGQRNPILAIGNSTGGLGFDWQISRQMSLQGSYSAELPSVPTNSNIGGLFGGRTTTGVQLVVAPTDSLDIGLHYLYSYSPDGSLATGIGDAQLLSPFAAATPFNTNAVGATLAWRVNPQWTLGTWGGWTVSAPVLLPGTVETNNWMVFSAFPDLFARGNLGGILVGQPPRITSSTLPNGFNLPNFSVGGTEGGRPDASLHLEIFYRARLTDNISLTPGVIMIFRPDHNLANDTLTIGTLRTTLQF